MKNTVNIRLWEQTWKRLKKKAIDRRVSLMQLLDDLSKI